MARFQAKLITPLNAFRGSDTLACHSLSDETPNLSDREQRLSISRNRLAVATRIPLCIQDVVSEIGRDKGRFVGE